jgi:hypothetical protein
MIKLLAIMAFSLSTLAGGGHVISSVETRNGWVFMYDENGKKYQTLSVNSVGEVKGFSSTFFVSVNNSWVYLYDAEGRRYQTLSLNSVGEVIGVAGDTFTSRNGGWIYTWSKEGRKINTRSAH